MTTDNTDNAIITIPGFRVELRARPDPSRGGWVATVGNVSVVAGDDPLVGAQEIRAWGQTVQGRGDTAAEARDVIAGSLRTMVDRLGQTRRATRLEEANAAYQERMNERKRNPPWGVG